MDKIKLYKDYESEAMSCWIDTLSECLIPENEGHDLVSLLDEADDEKNDDDRHGAEDRAKSNMLYLAGQIWKETGEDEWLERCRDNLPSDILWTDEANRKEILSVLWGNEAVERYYELKNVNPAFLEGDLDKFCFYSGLIGILYYLDDELQKEAMPYIVEYIRNLDIKSGFQGDISSQSYVMSAIMDKFLVHLNFDMTMELFLEHEHICEYDYQIPYISLCITFAERLETDHGKALHFSELAYAALRKCKDEVPKWLEWTVRYDYASFRSLFNMELGSYGDLFIGLYDDMVLYEERDGFKWEERFDIILLKTLYWIINYGMYYSVMTEEYIEYTQKYYELSVKLDHYFSKNKGYNKKTALYYLGLAYERMGEYLVAEGYYKQAHELKYLYPNKDVDFFVALHLGFMCLHQNNDTGMYHYTKQLYQQVLQGDYPEGATANDLLRVTLMYSSCLASQGARKHAYFAVQRILDKGIVPLDPVPQMLYLTALDMAQNLIEISEPLDAAGMEKIKKYLEMVSDVDYLGSLPENIRLLGFIANAVLHWKDGDDSLIDAAQQAFVEEGGNIKRWETTMYSGIGIRLLSVRMHQGHIAEAEEIASRLLGFMEWSLGTALVYQNRRRLEAVVQDRMIVPLAVYPVIREKTDGKAYELVLNFKNERSLIAVYQNKKNVSNPERQQLCDEINGLLDSQSMDLMDAFYHTGMIDEWQKVERQLNEKEYEYARRYKDDAEYQPFQLNDVKMSMPDDSVFIEYFQYIDGYYDKPMDSRYYDEQYILDHIRYDAFCFIKREGICSVRHEYLGDKDIVHEVEFYAKEMGERFHKKIKTSRQILYKLLLERFEKETSCVETVYIAPDGILLDVPFEVLTDANDVMIGDMKDIVYVDTGRDFLRKSTDDFSDRFISIGNPEYNVKEYVRSGRERKSILDDVIKKIPYTEIEVRALADEFGGEVYVGVEAERGIMSKIQGAGRIHLAIHGMYEEELLDYDWLASALMFSGAENWRKTGITDERFGNGVITADEISRMDLGNTEMVVLSSCFAGKIAPGGWGSIRTAFRAAGVKYVVSPLWEVDDMAGTVFMIIFYRLLENYTIPNALRLAKKRFRTITVGEVYELLDRLSRIYNMNTDKDIQEGLIYLESIIADETESYPIYADPYYWSVFICSQNTF